MNIERTTVDNFYVGNDIADATPQPIVAAGYAPALLYKGVRVRADSANADTIYVGNQYVSATNGFPLVAGEEIDVQVSDIHSVYVVSGTTTNSVQVVTVTSLNGTGKFTLTFMGETTTALAASATSGTVHDALEALTTIGADNLTVTGNAGGPYTVTFTGDFAALDVAPMTGECVNELQTITVTGAAAGDTMVLTIAAEDTGPLAVDASAAAIQAELESLTAIGTGNCEVTGTGPYAVEFIGSLSDTDVSAITGVGGKNEVQTITVSTALAGDTMILTCGANSTGALAYNITGANLETALRALPSIGAGNCAVTGNGPYTVEFISGQALTDMPAITGVGGKNEVQTITVSAGAVGDTMVLTCGANSTGALAYDITGANLETALRALLSIGAGNCTVTGDGPYTVEFISGKALTDMPAITGIGGKNEVQTITIAAGAAGDTMVLTCDGQSTSALAYDITGANLQTALRGLTSIGADNCTVTGDGPYAVEFVAGKALTDMPAITGVGGKNEVQTITVTDGAAGATMVLTCDGQSTSALAYDITGADLQTALRGLTSIGAGNCVVTGNGPYAVEFVSGKALTDMPAITGVGGQNEVQTITISSGVVGNTMVLTCDGSSTSALAYDIAGADLQTALRALASIGAGNCTVTGDGPYVVEFIDGKALTDMPAITGVGGHNEVQTITVAGGAAGDTMVLTCDGQSTSALAYDITGADLQTALRGLTSIGAGNCTVTGDGPYAVEFIAGKALTDIPAITGTAAKNEKQTVTLNGVTSGTFTLTYATKTTSDIDYDSTAQEVQEALEGLSNVTAGDVTVTGTTPEWVVEFTGTLAETNIAMLTGDDTNLVGDPSTITIVQTVQGSGATVGVVETFKGNALTVDVVENYKGCTLVVGVVETYTGNELTVGVVETFKGNALTVGVVETFKGNALAVGVVETFKGNTATVTVVETIKGDPDGTVVAVKTVVASDESHFAWIAE